MPYGIPGETPEQIAKMERCVTRVLPQMKKKYKKPKVAKSHAIAICKSAVMKKRDIQSITPMKLRSTCKSYTAEFIDADEMVVKPLMWEKEVKAYYTPDGSMAMLEFMKPFWDRDTIIYFIKKNGKRIINTTTRKANMESIPAKIVEKLDAEFKMPYEFDFIAIREGMFNGKFYSWEEIKKGSQSLDGKDITLNHSDNVRDVVGNIVRGSLWLDENIKALRGKGVIMDEQIARMIHDGRAKHVSVEVWGEEMEDENEKNQINKFDLEFDAISIVKKGACAYPNCGINTSG